MARITSALQAAAALLLLAALALRVAPAPVGAGVFTPARPAMPATSLGAAAGDPADASQTIVGGNVFSRSRTAPRTRYTPPDLAAPERPAPAVPAVPPPRLRLLGTVLGPSGATALIAADTGARGAEIYRVGDAVGGRRILAISESTVVLGTGAGRSILRLPSPRSSTP